MSETGQVQGSIALEKARTPGQMVLNRFLKNRLAIAGALIISLMFVFSLIGPLLSPYREDEIFYNAGMTEVLIYAPPSASHPLGTDIRGMDIMTRLMYGGRISLTIGFVVVLIETSLGVLMGGLAGYYGKWVDNLIMRLVDVFNCIPFLPVMLLIGVTLGKYNVSQSARIYILMAVMGVLGWPYIARIVRGQILSLREQEFMLAVRATGIRPFNSILRHLIPNVIPQIIVIATMNLGGIILTESALSYLGIGVSYPLASWGNMIESINNAYLMENYPFTWIPAGVCILMTVLAFNFIGDGLRDAFDPKMKR